MPTPPPSCRAYAVALALAALFWLPGKSLALNDTFPEYRPVQQQPGGASEGNPDLLSAPTLSEESGEDSTVGAEERSGDVARPDTTPGEEPPEVIYDLSRLPEPVRRMRQLIIDACKSGDIEKLRPLIGSGDSATQLLLGNLEGDPIDFLRQISGDEEGQEIMAILLEVMESGFVHLNAGAENEYYVWPYFFAFPLDELSPQQKVELFTLLTASDYEEMKNFGAYIFYRSAITPDGRWLFFVAGD
ncbi:MULTISPECIES: hypothetical protein [Chelativorans]|uniref:Uncharacterized protein n=1 Tax=Chelativorans sp. (strain BNC1) TaxID=266779 RepID=Q11JR8_CHESB|nr:MULTISPECIES: hypothetical protein [Chelativorans]